MGASIRIEPFTAARLELAGEEERNAELTRIGLRFLKQRKLMAWDGHDFDRALDLALIAYRSVLQSIKKAQVSA